jgi:hypothetical protein
MKPELTGQFYPELDSSPGAVLYGGYHWLWGGQVEDSGAL